MPNVTTGSGTGATLTGANNYYFCTGMCSVTPPAPAAGVQFCVANAPGVSKSSADIGFESTSARISSIVLRRFFGIGSACSIGTVIPTSNGE